MPLLSLGVNMQTDFILSIKNELINSMTNVKNNYPCFVKIVFLNLVFLGHTRGSFVSV